MLNVAIFNWDWIHICLRVILKCDVISTYSKCLIFLCLADWFPVWLECVSDWIFRSVALCEHDRLWVRLPNLHSNWRVWREWYFSEVNIQRWPWFCCWHCTFRCKGSVAVLSMLENFSVYIHMWMWDLFLFVCLFVISSLYVHSTLISNTKMKWFRTEPVLS